MLASAVSKYLLASSLTPQASMRPAVGGCPSGLRHRRPHFFSARVDDVRGPAAICIINDAPLRSDLRIAPILTASASRGIRLRARNPTPVDIERARSMGEDILCHRADQQLA